jgi:hypothetical protein
MRAKLGVDAVIASDVRSSRRLLDSGPFSYCDVLDKDALARIILENGVTHVLHLATLLSGALSSVCCCQPWQEVTGICPPPPAHAHAYTRVGDACTHVA